MSYLSVPTLPKANRNSPKLKVVSIQLSPTSLNKRQIMKQPTRSCMLGSRQYKIYRKVRFNVEPGQIKIYSVPGPHQEQRFFSWTLENLRHERETAPKVQAFIRGCLVRMRISKQSEDLITTTLDDTPIKDRHWGIREPIAEGVKPLTPTSLALATKRLTPIDRADALSTPTSLALCLKALTQPPKGCSEDRHWGIREPIAEGVKPLTPTLLALAHASRPTRNFITDRSHSRKKRLRQRALAASKIQAVIRIWLHQNIHRDLAALDLLPRTLRLSRSPARKKMVSRSPTRKKMVSRSPARKKMVSRSPARKKMVKRSPASVRRREPDLRRRAIENATNFNRPQLASPMFDRH